MKKQLKYTLLTIFISVNVYSVSLPLVAIVSTGGTISQVKNPKGPGLIPAKSGQQILRSVPGIKKIARLKIINFSEIDSSQMTPNMWGKLARVVKNLEQDPKVTGIVITHGTDTMSEAAYFLNLVLPRVKPVIFTGSMRSASSPFPDGGFNLTNAIKEAVSPLAEHWGVTLNFNQHIMSADYVQKRQANNVQAFSSGQKGDIAYMQNDQIMIYHQPKHHQQLPLPKKLPKVALISAYSGADAGNFVRYAAKHGFKGIVLESLGAGNVNKHVYAAVKYALKHKIVVVDATRVPEDGVVPIYGDVGGAAMMQKNGVVLAGLISPPKARLLLILALSEYGHNSRAIQTVFDQMQ